MDKFLLDGGIQFGPPCLEWYEKTKKCSLDVRKKSEKLKILSKLFCHLPIRRQKCRFDNKAANFPAKNPTFPCPKWEIVSQSQHIVFVKVFLWTSKMPFWQFCWNVSPKFEKFWLKMHFWRLLKYFRREFNKFCLKNQTKPKNQHVFDKNTSKLSRVA